MTHLFNVRCDKIGSKHKIYLLHTKSMMFVLRQNTYATELLIQLDFFFVIKHHLYLNDKLEEKLYIVSFEYWVDIVSEVNKMSLFKESHGLQNMLMAKVRLSYKSRILKICICSHELFLMSWVMILLNVLLKIIWYNKTC